MSADTLAKLRDSPWAWVVAVVVLLLLWECGKKWVPGAVEWVAKRLAGVLAGTRLMRSRALRIYRRRVAERYARLPVLFMPGMKIDVSTVYVPLQATEAGGDQTEDAYDRIRSTDHSVVLGGPGSGKSMLLRHSMLTWAQGPRRKGGRIPVLLELHRCNGNTESLEDLIVRQFGDDGFEKAERFVVRSLRDGGLALLFDGLDEVGASERNRVTRMLRDFAAHYPHCQIVITCRTAIYDRDLSPEIITIFQVAAFDERHIRRFLRQWPGIAEGIEVERLLAALRNTPRLMQLAGNPLLLTMIAYLYGGKTNQDRILPHSRAEFYRDATEELLDRLKHEANRFEGRKKKAVLRRLALVAQDAPAATADRRTLSYDTVRAEIEGMMRRLNIAAADIDGLLDEIVDRSGLLLRIDGGERYQFAHLTLQEYLAALALEDDMTGLLDRYQHAPDDWREVVKLWCGSVNRDSGPLIHKVYELDPVLALECLADAQVIEETVAEEIISHFQERITTPAGQETPAVITAFGLVAADPRPRGRRLYEFLVEQAQQDSLASVLAALAETKLPEAAEHLAGHLTRTAVHSDLAEQTLLTMGDLAVPALAQAAALGRTEAVDALGKVGTAAAATALEQLIWREGSHPEDRITRRAAWRLAALIDDPEIESALCDCSESETRPILPWVWPPFRADCTPAFSHIAERIAYLLDTTPDEQVPTDVSRIDPRLAIPLCVLGRESNLQSLHRAIPRPRGLGKLDESSLEHLVDWVAGHMRPRYQRLFATLGFQVQARLLVRLLAVPEDVEQRGKTWPSPVPVRERDWADVRKVEERFVFPKTAAYRVMFATAIMLFLAIVAGGVSLAVTGWPLGPVWLGWLLVCASVLFRLLFIGWRFSIDSHYEFLESEFLEGFYSAVWLFRQMVRGYIFDKDDIGTGAIAVFVLLVSWAEIVLAVVVGQHYLGWLGAATVLATGSSVVTALAIYGKRRERASRNPLRGLLELDEATARRRTSVIAG